MLRIVIIMLACAAVGYLLGRTRGMGLHGFFMGLAFGPIGWGLILLWPTSWIQGPVPREAAPGMGPRPSGAHRGRPDAAGDTGSGSRSSSASGPTACPRCAHPAPSDAGACPHCGNVLVPIRYRVNPG